MAIYYKHEIVYDLRKIRKRADTVEYFCYDNGHRVKPDHAQEIRGILSDAIEKVEAIRCVRTKDKFENWDYE